LMHRFGDDLFGRRIQTLRQYRWSSHRADTPVRPNTTTMAASRACMTA
jgi:hypothetical protein